MQTVRDQEYDAFGPWLIYIDDESLLPKRFIDHVDMTIDYEYIVKVPVNKDRRDLRPGMDMYDAVIGLYEDSIYIYERQDTEIKETIVNVLEITSMVIHNDLLAGHLYLYLTNSEFVFKYNTISKEVVEDLTNRIRAKYSSNDTGYNFEYVSENEVKSLEHYYQSEWPALKRVYPSLDILSLQKITNLSYPNMNVAKKLINYLKRSTLKSCLYMTNGHELILSKNGEDFGRKRKSDYSISYTFIPFNRINHVDIEDDQVTEEIKYLKVSTGSKMYKFAFHEENKWMEHLRQNLLKVC